jgi:hypothetical protein
MRMEVHLLIQTDRLSFELECPSCGFQNPATIKQARLRDAVICRGCKATIRLDDQMNECRKTVRHIGQRLRDLKKQMKDISINIKL